MRTFAANLLGFGRSRLLRATFALAVPFSAGASPAQAQDLFGLFRMMFQPSCRHRCLRPTTTGARVWTVAPCLVAGG